MKKLHLLSQVVILENKSATWPQNIKHTLLSWNFFQMTYSSTVNWRSF